MIRIRQLPFAALCAAAIVSACSKGDTTADSVRAADSAAAANASATPAPAPAPAPTLTDANIFAALDEANRADSATGSLASTKGTGAEIKAYGREMMRDHHALRAGGQDLAKKLNITPEPPAGDSTQARDNALADSLTATPKGAAWDKYYIDNAVLHHQMVLSTAQSALAATQNAEIKDLLTKASPIVQDHLDKAKAIQAKLQ